MPINVPRVSYYLLRLPCDFARAGRLQGGMQARESAVDLGAWQFKLRRQLGSSCAQSRLDGLDPALPSRAERDQVGPPVSRVRSALELAASVEAAQRVHQCRQRHAHLSGERGRRDRLDGRDQAEEGELLTADSGLL